MILYLASEASSCEYMKDLPGLAEDNTLFFGCEESHHPNIASQYCVVISDHEDLFFFCKKYRQFRQIYAGCQLVCHNFKLYSAVMWRDAYAEIRSISCACPHGGASPRHTIH